jgi:hypothetical protein
MHFLNWNEFKDSFNVGVNCPIRLNRIKTVPEMLLLEVRGGDTYRLLRCDDV